MAIRLLFDFRIVACIRPRLLPHATGDGERPLSFGSGFAEGVLRGRGRREKGLLYCILVINTLLQQDIGYFNFQNYFFNTVFLLFGDTRLRPLHLCRTGQIWQLPPSFASVCMERWTLEAANSSAQRVPSLARFSLGQRRIIDCFSILHFCVASVSVRVAL